jgi:Zinc-finger of C2H2 type
MQPTTPDKSSLPSSSISPEEKRDWISMINESVHTYDDIDIGDVYAVSRNFIVIKRGFVNVHYYYIPIKKVEGWDGNVLWLRITEEEVKEKYERDIIPDPNQYYVKEYPYYTGFGSYNYPLPVIVRRYPDAYEEITKSLPEKNVPLVYRCGLCEENFNSESELDKHMDGVRH